MKMGKISVSPTHRPPSTPGKNQCYSFPNDPIWNRARNLASYNEVPRPTTSPRVLLIDQYKIKLRSTTRNTETCVCLGNSVWFVVKEGTFIKYVYVHNSGTQSLNGVDDPGSVGFIMGYQGSGEILSDIMNWFNSYPTAFPYGNGMVLQFCQQ